MTNILEKPASSPVSARAFFRAPLPRYRLYSSLHRYAYTFAEILKGRAKHGDDVALIEKAISDLTGREHAIAVSQARMGIYLTVKALVEPGKTVIMSPYTIADVVNMVICAGAIPVFCDVEANTCNIDPHKIAPLINRDTGAVMITHLHGLAAHPAEIRAICDDHDVPLIEDSAQAFGAIVGETRTGAFGKAGIFSFGMFKNINAAYGGMVITDDDELAATIRSFLCDYQFESVSKLFKRVSKGLITDLMTWPPLFKTIVFRIFRFGLLNDIEMINRRVRTELDTSRYDSLRDSYRKQLTPLQARLAISQLDGIDRDTKCRIQKAKIYHDGLNGIPELILPPPIFDGSHIYTYYPVRCRNRDAVIRFLMKNGCDVAPQHLKNCAALPGFEGFGHPCPKAEETAAEIVLLPTYPRYSDRDVHRNVEILKRCCSAGIPTMDGTTCNHAK